MSRQHFAAGCLLSHGAIKFWLIVGLWRKNYPILMAKNKKHSANTS